jgi:hypothetical protein
MRASRVVHRAGVVASLLLVLACSNQECLFGSEATPLIAVRRGLAAPRKLRGRSLV